MKIKGSEILASKSEHLLGVTIDSNLTFEEHINSLCKKANQKLHALSRVANYMSMEKRRILLNTFITSQFNYCPLVWMSCNRTLNHKINKIHQKAFRIVYKNEKSTSIFIHQRNIQYVANRGHHHYERNICF